MELVWLALGSNLLKPLYQINLALDAIHKLPNTRIITCSSYYRSKPLGLQDQPDFCNVVVSLETFLLPEIFLKYIQLIEQCQGRIRTLKRWGPRTLDLDILLFGDQIINTPNLQVPHYDMHNRQFVLYPLAELAPNLYLPNGLFLKNLLQRVNDNNLIYW